MLDHVEDKSAEPLLEVSDIIQVPVCNKTKSRCWVCYDNSNNQISHSWLNFLNHKFLRLLCESLVANKMLPCRGCWKLELNSALYFLIHLNAWKILFFWTLLLILLLGQQLKGHTRSSTMQHPRLVTQILSQWCSFFLYCMLLFSLSKFVTSCCRFLNPENHVFHQSCPWKSCLVNRRQWRHPALLKGTLSFFKWHGYRNDTFYRMSFVPLKTILCLNLFFA